MALGLNWEWRGFGVVSSNFAHRFCGLDPLLAPHKVEDLYLWIPGLEVNAKIRTGAEGDLKVKRIKNRDEGLEQWHENPAEIFDFPLDEAGWHTLGRVLAGVDAMLGPYPSVPPNRATTLAHLELVGSRSLEVHKLRESRLAAGPNAKVKVEWACISRPQAILSIGLETWSEGSAGDGLLDELAKEDILCARKKLGLANEPLDAMNYLDAVAVWASSETI